MLQRKEPGLYQTEDGRIVVQQVDGFEKKGRGHNRVMTKVKQWIAFVDGHSTHIAFATKREALEDALNSVSRHQNK